LIVLNANALAVEQIAEKCEKLISRGARSVEAREFLEFRNRELEYGRLRPREIPGKKIDGERVEVAEGLAGKISVQENYVTPILLGHVAIAGNEAVYAAVVAVRNDAAFDCGVVREAVAEAETLVGGERRLRIFHASDGFRSEKLSFACGTTAEKKLNELREFSGRSLQVIGGAEIDFFVGDRLDQFAVRTLIALSEEGAILRSEIEVADRNLEWSKDIVANVRSPRLAADFFDQVAGDTVVGIGVGEASAGRPAHVLRIRESLQNLEHGNCWRVARVVDLAKGHVVKAGRVLKEIRDANRIGGFPGILERNFGRDVLQAGLKIDAAFFLKFEKCKRDKSLADGADAELGFAGDVAILGEVGFADAATPEERAVADEGDACAGNVFGIEDFFRCGLEFFEGFGMRQFVLFCERLLREKKRWSCEKC